MLSRVTALLVLMLAAIASAQPALQIAWRHVTQVRSNAAGGTPTVDPLPTLAQPATTRLKVDRIAVSPAIISSKVGKPVCIGQLDVAAYTDQGQRAPDVLLILDMQEEQLRNVTFSAKGKDLCLTPMRAGEFTLRFSSRVPAADGTFRGAQIFVRVS
jgi:hypothetical protein